MVALAKKRDDSVFDGAKLRELRLAKKLTQARLVELADVHVIDVSRYERDAVEPSYTVAVRLASALGVDVGEFQHDGG